MDTKNSRPIEDEEPGSEAEDLKSQLQLDSDSRQRVVNIIVETLKRRLPVSGGGPEELSKLRKIGVGFEEKVYSTACNQSDYLRKISVKMLTMQAKYKRSVENPLPSNSTLPSNNPLD